MTPIDPTNFAWPEEQVKEIRSAWKNGRVGSTLVSETEDVRVWHLLIRPGERFGFHMHVLDYFWSALTSGRAKSYLHDGATVEVEYAAGETQHMSFKKDDFMMHDLANIGDTDLLFVTVEHKNSSNAPLHISSPDVTEYAK